MARRHVDKVPALMRAADEADDPETSLILLNKAKSLDPRCLEVYQRIADVHARMGNLRSMAAELRSILAVDPLHWETRLQLLNVEHASHGSLSHAAAVLRDLIWEREYPLRFFNVCRAELRTECELSYDEALLGHMGLHGRFGSGVLRLAAVDAHEGGAVAVLNSTEPWLQIFEPGGDLRLGIDLWIEEEAHAVGWPLDVAFSGDGVVYLADHQAGKVRRFRGSDGAGLGGFTVSGRGNRPVALHCSHGGSRIQVLGTDGSLRAYDRFGRAIGGRKTPVLQGDPVGWGLTVDPKGEAHLTDGSTIVSLGRRGRPGRSVKIEGGPGQPGDSARHGMAWDDSRKGFLVAQPGRGAIARLSQTGALEERLTVPDSAGGPLRQPEDVSAASDGSIVVADTGNARIMRRAADGAWSQLFGHAGWSCP